LNIWKEPPTGVLSKYRVRGWPLRTGTGAQIAFPRLDIGTADAVSVACATAVAVSWAATVSVSWGVLVGVADAVGVAVIESVGEMVTVSVELTL